MNYKTYKYLIKPTALQKEAIKTTLECCTYVFNRFIEEKENGVVHSKLAKEILAEYKRDNEFLNLVDSSALMNTLFKLQDLSDKVYKKKNKSVTSYTTSNLSGRQAIYLIGNEYINLPRLGNVKIVLHRSLPIESIINKATVSIDNTNNYFVCLTIQYQRNNNNTIDINKSIGLDYSSSHLYVDSNGNKVDMEHFTQKHEERLSKLKSALTRCQKNSNNYYEIKNKISRIYKKTVNQRMDFLHKLTTKLANENDLICVEDINMNVIAGRYHLAKNTYDNGYGMFLEMLKYKLEDRGKVLVKIDKYYPSSKKCNCCGYINNNLKLSERVWICPSCGKSHDRDINAALNILNRGKEKFTSIGYLDYAYENRKHTTLNYDPEVSI